MLSSLNGHLDYFFKKWAISFTFVIFWMFMVIMTMKIDGIYSIPTFTSHNLPFCLLKKRLMGAVE